LRPLPVIALIAALSACATFPDLGGVGVPAGEAPFPALMPVEQLLAEAAVVQVLPETEAALKARIVRLRERAARLRGVVLDSPSRQRLAQPIVPPVSG